MLCDFYKIEESDKVWWAVDLNKKGPLYFSFDKKKIYNLFRDYPDVLTKEEKEIFDSENEFWVDFFSGKDDE